MWRTSLRDQWRDVRNRLLASKRFHRWAADFPPARYFARRRARALFDIVAGFAYTQTLRACVEVRLFEILAEAPRTVDELSSSLGLSKDSTRTLLRAAAALELLERRTDGRYVLGDLGAIFSSAPGLAEMVVHNDLLYADLADPVALLRSRSRDTELAAFWSYAREGGKGRPSDLEARDYSALMAASQSLLADNIIDSVSFARHKALLDVGGGDGTFAVRVAERHPRLSISLCDLPPVAEIARRKIANAGFADRVCAVSCDFRVESLPEGADMVTLIRVLHDHDDAVVERLLDAAWRTLPEGGTIVIAEPMSGARGAERVGDAYFGLYLHAMGSGCPRTAQEISQLLERAGFSSVRHVATALPLVASVVTGVKRVRQI